MKSVYLIFLALVGCAFAPPSPAQQVDDLGAAAAIRALESEWTVGQSRNDNRALDLIFDNALVYVEYGRLVSKAEYLSRIKHQEPGVSQVIMGPITVEVFGTTALAMGTYLEKQLLGGRRRVQRWRFIDTWVYEKQGWVLVAAGASPLAN